MKNEQNRAFCKDEAWRTTLGRMIRTDKNLVHILARRLEVHELTIFRWCAGETNPHKLMRTLRVLLDALPSSHQEGFLQAIHEDFPHFQVVDAPSDDEQPAKEIPTELVARILQANASVNDAFAFWSISNLIAQQLYGHLDADGASGVTITLFACTPPAFADQTVRSFYVPSEQSNERPNLLKPRFPLLIGSEAVLTWAMMTRSTLVLQTSEIPTFLQGQIGSIAAHVIQRRGKIGGLLVLTSQKERFFNKNRERTISLYASLAVLALSEQDFYSANQIALGLFPSFPQQQELELRYPFKSRARDQRRTHPQLNQQELERLALHHLEDDLLNSPVDVKNEHLFLPN